MSDMVAKAAQLMEMLPEDAQNFAYAFIQKLVQAWDPEFTKLTPDEAKRVDAAEKSGFVDDDDIDWDKVGS